MFELFYSLFAFILAISILVAFHEWGHFYAARKLGIHVLKFSIGFGKPIWKKIGKDGVEYIIAWIPLGGYVKMLDEREGPVEQSLLHKAFNRQALWKRNIVIVAGPLANILLAVVFYWIMFMVGVQEQRAVLGDLPAEGLAAKSGLKPGMEVIAVDGTSTVSWQDVNLAIVKRIGDKQPIVVTAQLPNQTEKNDYAIDTMQWVVDDRSPELLNSLGFVSARMLSIIGNVIDGGAADKAGLKPDDRILSIAGTPIKYWRDIVASMAQHKGGRVDILVEREGEQLTFSLEPEQKEGRYLIGINNKPINMKHNFITFQYGFFESFQQAWVKTGQTIALTGTMFKKLFVGEISAKSLGGPLSIADGAGVSLRNGFEWFIAFLALISINLGLINLLPIPVLDGGHLMLNTAEAIKGRPLSERAQELTTQLGLLLVLVMMSWAIFNDFARFFS